MCASADFRGSLARVREIRARLTHRAHRRPNPRRGSHRSSPRIGSRESAPEKEESFESIAVDRDDVLSSLIAELHEGATTAIHDQQLAAFEATALEYRELLLAFPRSWSSHNIRYTEELTTGIGLDLGIFSRIEPLMRDEMREVMKTGNVRMANALCSLTFRVGGRRGPLWRPGTFSADAPTDDCRIHGRGPAAGQSVVAGDVR